MIRPCDPHRPFVACPTCAYQGAESVAPQANRADMLTGNEGATRYDGGGKDERPPAPTGGRSSHSDSLQEPGGMGS